MYQNYFFDLNTIFFHDDSYTLIYQNKIIFDQLDHNRLQRSSLESYGEDNTGNRNLYHIKLVISTGGSPLLFEIL